VYKAFDNKKKKQVALKKMILEVAREFGLKFQVEQEGVPSTALREISLLRETCHLNIVGYGIA